MRSRLRRFLSLVALTLIVGCGGSGTSTPPEPSGWTSWEWAGSTTGPDPAPDLVTFNDGTSDVTLMASPGHVTVAFGPSVNLADATVLIEATGGTVLDCIPELHLLLASVAVGAEGDFITALPSGDTVTRATPNASTSEKVRLFAVEECSTSHDTRVRALLDCASGGTSTATCLDRAQALGGSWGTLKALVETLFTNDDVVVNLSLGARIPKNAPYTIVNGCVSTNFNNWTLEAQEAYLATEYSIVSFVLRGLQTAQSLGLGKNTVLVFAAGNETAPMWPVLARLSSEYGDTFYNHVVFVGTPSSVYSNSNYVGGSTSIDSNFILTNSASDEQPCSGTSLSAPRVAGLLGKMVRDQGLRAPAALASLLSSYAAGGVLSDPCQSLQAIAGVYCGSNDWTLTIDVGTGGSVDWYWYVPGASTGAIGHGTATYSSGGWDLPNGDNSAAGGSDQYTCRVSEDGTFAQVTNIGPFTSPSFSRCNAPPTRDL